MSKQQKSNVKRHQLHGEISTYTSRL